METAGQTGRDADRDGALASVDGPLALVRLGPGPVPVQEVADALEGFDRAPGVRCLVVAGVAEAGFAVGPGPSEAWDRLRRLRKPVVAAVGGPAVGAGCELALACDIVVAGEAAVFGQPETGSGETPCGGATQRLPRAVGKALAMDMLLSGRLLGAREALSRGLVSRVVPAESCLDEALGLAREIAKRPPAAVALAKEGASRALDMDLETGLSYERRLSELARSAMSGAEEGRETA